MEILRRISPKRVLMTADTVGGVWNYALEVCRALEPFGIEVALATMGEKLKDEQRRAVAERPNVQVHESTYKLEWMDDPWEDVAESGRWLLDLAAKVRPDVVHLNGYAHGALRWHAPVLVVGHSCVYSWFESVRGSEPSESWSRYRREVSAGLRGATLVTAPTQTMLAALRRHYGAFAAGPAVYNGRRASEYPVREKEPFVLTAGRLWDEAKNVGMLDYVAPDLRWPSYMAGEERHPDNGGEARFDGVRMLGRLAPAELAQWMSRASIYVLPARYEPFGLTALEAALAGCTLVLGDIPSLREVWGSSAAFVPPNDGDALRNALQRLIEDEEARMSLARQSRSRALVYTPERMARGYMDLYRMLLSVQAHDEPVLKTRVLRKMTADG